jgi:hypothetical protein
MQGVSMMQEGPRHSMSVRARTLVSVDATSSTMGVPMMNVGNRPKLMGNPMGMMGNLQPTRATAATLTRNQWSGRRDSNPRPSPWQKLWFTPAESVPVPDVVSCPPARPPSPPSPPIPYTGLRSPLREIGCWLSSTPAPRGVRPRCHWSLIFAPSMRTNAILQSRFVRLDHEWLVARWMSTSPGLISVSPSSIIAQISPSRTMA